MLARVKQDYAAGAVMAFSGREYIRGEWRDVPAGFEDQAKKHPLLDTQPSTKEIRKQGPLAPGLPEPAAEGQETAVTTVTAEPAAEPTTPSEPEPTTSRRRKRTEE